MTGIYKITSPSNKVYIGQSWDIESRWKGYHNGRSHSNIKKSIKKYGVKNHKFEIAHELPSDVDQQTLDNYEQLYMDCYRDAGITLLNIKDGGNCGKMSEEIKRQIALTLTGYKATEERKEKMRVTQGKIQKTNDKNPCKVLAVCEHCGVEMSIMNIAKYHNDKCKNKK